MQCLSDNKSRKLLRPEKSMLDTGMSVQFLLVTFEIGPPWKVILKGIPTEQKVPNGTHSNFKISKRFISSKRNLADRDIVRTISRQLGN